MRASSFFAASLLGRHVGDCAERGAGLGELVLGHGGLQAAEAWVRPSPVCLASPKSRTWPGRGSVTKILAGLISR